MRPDKHCTICGCPLVALTKCLSCHCEKNKWNEVLTQEQEEELNEKD